MQTDEILNAPAAPIAEDATERASTPTPSAVPSVKASPTEVLITEQQVMFGTAAAVVPRRENRFVAALGRVFATSTAESRSPRQRNQPRRMYYIEDARMGREMDRL